MPKITVLMPVFNAGEFLDKSIDSILSQTFSDFEFLIIDDASTDDSVRIVERYQDARIRHLRNNGNKGVALTLNRGLDEAKGDYIARMDADDICTVDRLEYQYATMDANPGIGVLGSWVRFIGRYKGVVGRRPWGSDCVKAALCLENPLFHPSVMMRTSILDTNHLRYNEKFSCSEDYDLWSRVANVSGIDNVPEPLLNYRVYPGSVTSRTRIKMEDQSLLILKRELSRIGLSPTETELRFHRDIGQGKRLDSYDEVNRAEAWFSLLAKKNLESGPYSDNGMKTAIGFAWFQLCSNCGNLGSWIAHKYKTSQVSQFGYKPAVNEWIRFIGSIIKHALLLQSRPK